MRIPGKTFDVKNITPGHHSLILCALGVICCAQLTAQEPQEQPFEFQVKVNTVLVPVLVRDKQGRTVSDLKKEDFQVLDQNTPRVITGFTVEQRAAVGGGREAEVAPPPTPRGTPQPSTPAGRFIVFFFDDLHLGFSDLQQMKPAATSVIAGSLAPSDVAAVVSTSGVSSGLTRDHAKLEETLAKLVPRQLYRHDEHGCPNVTYYQADQIIDWRNAEAFELAVRAVATCAHLDIWTWRSVAESMVSSAADKALRLGDRDVLVTLGVLRGYVEKMGSLPGQRTLILLSPGFLTITPPVQTELSRILDLAARLDVTISALEARGLFTNEPKAEESGATSAALLAPGLERTDSQARQESMLLEEAVMGELADGSGGSFFHNSNDLKGGLESLTAAPECLYVLQVSLGDVKPDGAYHRLKVKVDREGLQLQARRGYFAPKPTKTKKLE